MVSHPRDYPWSSHRHFAYGETGSNSNWLIAPDQYLALARGDEARRKAYRDLFKTDIDIDDLNAIRDSAHKGWALGDEKFLDMIEAMGERRAAPAARGRPKKAMKNVV